MNPYDYQAPERHTFALNDLESRATMAKAAVGVVTAAYVLLSVMTVVVMWSPNTAFTAVVATGTLIGAFVFIAMTLFAGAIWMYWASKLYDNLSDVFGVYPKHSKTRAVWSYIIPFMNLYAPYQFMKEAWEKTSPHDRADQSVLQLWWGLWIAGSILSQLEVRAFPDLTGLNYLCFSLLDVGMYVGAAVLAIRVVDALTSFQIELAAQHVPTHTSSNFGGPTRQAGTSNHPSNHPGPPPMNW